MHYLPYKYIKGWMKISTIVLSFSLFFSTHITAQSWLWGKQGNYNSAIPPLNSPMVAADKFGNVYMVNDYVDTIVFGSDTLINNFGNAYLVKYNSGGAEQWARQPIQKNKHSYSLGTSVATDPSGNVFIAGSFSDTMKFGSYTLTEDSAHFSDFIAKYDANGNVLWAKQSSSVARFYGHVYTVSIATDASGNVFMTGNFVDTLSFGPDTLVTGFHTSNTEIFVIKYDANGNVLWAKQSNSSAYSGGQVDAIATDKAGNVFITGDFVDTVSFGAFSLNESGFYNSLLVKYGPAGNELWAKQPNVSSSSSWSIPYSVTTDNEGNVYVTGAFSDTLSFGPYSVFSSSLYAGVFFAKYSGNGTPLWAEQPSSLYFDGDIHSSISGDTDNHIYMVFRDDTSTVTFGGLTLHSPLPPHSYYDGNLFIVKLDTSGKALCGSGIPLGIMQGSQCKYR